MGAWDYGVFDDDSAYDVMEDLKDCDNVAAYLEDAFDDATSAEYLEFDEGIAASVCGAVLDSILFGTAYRFDGFNSGDDGDGSKQYLNWIASIARQDSFENLKPKAIKALECLISEHSELSELWSDNEELYPKWKDVYLQMIKRLTNSHNLR